MTVFAEWSKVAEAYWHYRQDKRGIFDKTRGKANGARRAQAMRERQAKTALNAPTSALQPMRRADKRAEAVSERQARADGFVDPL
jgi:hypothetical protein